MPPLAAARSVLRSAAQAGRGWKLSGGAARIMRPQTNSKLPPSADVDVVQVGYGEGSLRWIHASAPLRHGLFLAHFPDFHLKTHLCVRF